MLISGQVHKGLVFAGAEVAVIGTDDAVRIINSNRSDVSKGLDLSCALLVLVISHVDIELLSTRLDSVPASQARGKVNVS